VFLEQIGDPLMDRDETPGRDESVRVLDHAEGQRAQVAALHVDYPIARAAQGRIEAEDDRHGREWTELSEFTGRVG
jgi:hypothetical protein